MGNMWDRGTHNRDERLAEIAAQKADGTLVVRQMTAAERERYGVKAPVTDPPRPRPARR